MKHNSILNFFNFERLLFLAVLFFLVLPPIFSRPVTLETVPVTPKLVAFMLLSCVYEELLYRLYLPAACFDFIRDFLPRAFWPAEIISAVLFGLGHRYLGVYAVFYALVFGALFRLIYCKIHNKGIAFSLIVFLHFLNNMLFMVSLA